MPGFISKFKFIVILVLLLLGLTYVGLNLNDSQSPTEVRIPSNSQLYITKISKHQPPLPPAQTQNLQKVETKSKAEPILSEEDIRLINLLPEEVKELARKDESYRNSLKKQYINQEDESLEPTTTQDDIENPYEALINNPDNLKRFDPNILPEGEDNPYREFLESSN